jgi:Uma2 family endonuclease
MSELLLPTRPRAEGSALVPHLCNGDHLSATEFLRRYDAAPEVKKAELVDGRVYIASPVRIDEHGEPSHLVQVWIGTYWVSTPGTRGSSDSTVRLGPADVPQPDVLLRVLPDFGGKARINAKGLLEGPPELVIEVAASSKSYDTSEKLETYRRAGVQEYLVWRTQDTELDWWQLVEDDYVLLQADEDGIIRSKVFPGLWLDAGALVLEDAAKVLAAVKEGLVHESHAEFVKSLAARRASA